MKSWDVSRMELQPHAPKILSSTNDARAIALALPAGECMQDHQVHERAWVSVLTADVETTTTAGERIAHVRERAAEHRTQRPASSERGWCPADGA